MAVCSSRRHRRALQSSFLKIIPGSQQFQAHKSRLHFLKDLEKIVLNRLLWLSRFHNWTSACQHGFREAKSTETTAHELITHWNKVLSRKKVCVRIPWHKKCFDSAWHPAILSCPLSDPKYQNGFQFSYKQKGYSNSFRCPNYNEY